MSQVTIRRCPVCSTIGERADAVLSALNKEPGVNAKIVDGAKGEFSVEVNGHRVAGKTGETLPTTEEVVAAVQNEALAGSVV